jgi:hypothetical protein
MDNKRQALRDEVMLGKRKDSLLAIPEVYRPERCPVKDDVKK